jgi:NDP-sugar pyrophosphorylase family protein
MVEIGDHPILWHIMNIYSTAGIDEFIICLGYKGYGFRPYYVTSKKWTKNDKNRMNFPTFRSLPFFLI